MRFPADLTHLTPEVLTPVLAERHPGVVVEQVRVVDRARCGDGVASTADRVALELAYPEGADGALPSRMMLKTILLHRGLRFGMSGIRTLAALWGLVIGWLITPPQNYGKAITTANLSRLVAAVRDLETLEALS